MILEDKAASFPYPIVLSAVYTLTFKKPDINNISFLLIAISKETKSLLKNPETCHGTQASPHACTRRKLNIICSQAGFIYFLSDLLELVTSRFRGIC